MPHSKMREEIAKILKKEGYVSDYVIEGGSRKSLRVYLKYTAEGDPVIRGLKRESTPGLRRYVKADALPRILGGLGVAIVTTSQGIMTDKEARKRKIGGEAVCSVW